MKKGRISSDGRLCADGAMSKYVHEDIWLEILSRLPIKPLLKSQSVCKPWKDIARYLRKQTAHLPRSIPLCGLVVRSHSFIEEFVRGLREISISYVCIGTNNIISLRTEAPDHNLPAISSGYDKGLLADLSFDFGALSAVSPSNTDRQGFFFTMHKGLLLLVLSDGTCQVHNPVTKEVLIVPKSPAVEKHGTVYPENNTGVIIRFPSARGEAVRFMVVRLWRTFRLIEIYNPLAGWWSRAHIRLDDTDLIRARWLFSENYVAFNITRNLYLFFLTDKDRGVVVKFRSSVNEKTRTYSFRLPEAAHGGYPDARLWECEGSLHLSYYNASGLWLWRKQHDSGGSTPVDAWPWIPLVDISSMRHLCKPVGQQHIVNALNAGDRVMPLAIHPYAAIVFLLVKCFIFAYDLTNDTLEKVAEINKQEYESIAFTLPFTPCLCSLPTPKHKQEQKQKLEQQGT